MLIRIENLAHTYMPGTTFEVNALHDINLTIGAGEMIGLIGHTGSGKSTLIQHLNGLLKPTSGKIYVDDIDLTAPRVNLKKVRQKVGLVFQYPEHQLFEETVAADVAFGPQNMGLSATEVAARVDEALALVGLDESVKSRSPFELSGGQRRRVAIAGVLAMRPEVLILDEPTAGLDPRGRDDLLKQIRKLHQERNLTVILVSHNMEDLAHLTERLIVMAKGTVVLDGSTRVIFNQVEALRKYKLNVPQVTMLMHSLHALGKPVKTDVLSVEEAKQEILRLMGRKKHV